MKTIVFLAMACLMMASIAVAGDPAADQAADMGMGAPPQMKELEFLVGTWDVASKMKMTPTDTNWMTATATCTYAYILDGSVMSMDYSGPMMGMNFHGFGWQAYNRHTKKWQVSWTDNMGGTISLYEGDKKDGVTVVSGTETMMGMTFQVKLTTYNQTATAFDWKYEQSMDGGKTWSSAMEAHYTKRAK